MTRIVTRPVPHKAAMMLEQAGISPVLARLFAARGISDADALKTDFGALVKPAELSGAERAAAILADAIAAGRQLVIIADYDCDGATACAVGMRSLAAFGAKVAYLVPNRFQSGYGLSPEIVRMAAAMSPRPDVLITVDNGISSVDGVQEARRLGLATVITDHHLPAETLPDADVIVNPNQRACCFPSKALAGVGVMFYVMLALRAELRRRGRLPTPEPNLACLLDLVALGTVADLVPLDANNRILVAQGLARMRAGRMQPGILALFRAAGRDPRQASTFDLGYALGPRLNAAGRLADMALGIECLITDDPGRALNIAQELDVLNRERRAIEAGMQEEALESLKEIDAGERASVALFDPTWHQGVIGIVAGRLKERLHRPIFAFARGNAGELKGSGRSIPGLHLRDCLDLVAKRHPGLLARFGGHAAAAGVTIAEEHLGRFTDALEEVAKGLLAPSALLRVLETDGPLETGYMTVGQAHELRAQTWGQAFPPPLFCDRFTVAQQRIVKDRHLKLVLEKNGSRFAAMQFHFAAAVPAQVNAVYRLGVDEYNGMQAVELMLEHIEPST